MRKTFFLLVVAVAIAIGAYIAYNYAMGGHGETSEADAAYSVTHEAILNEFMDNEEAANVKYTDKIIEITGPVLKVDKTEGRVTGVQLSSDESSVISCTFQGPQDESNLSGTITVKGVVSGFDFDPESMIPEPSLQLNRATIVTK